MIIKKGRKKNNERRKKKKVHIFLDVKTLTEK